MTMGIYGLYSLIDGTCLYIGCSKNIEFRYKNGHLKKLRFGDHRRKDFIDWFIENGRDESLIELIILEECLDVNELNPREVYWFNLEKPRFYGKIPSEKEKWKYTPAVSEKLSLKQKKYIADNGTIWDRMVLKYGLEEAKRMQSLGDKAKSGAGNANKPKSDAHKEAIRKSVLELSKQEFICELCERVCKGPSGFGSHKKACENKKR